MQYLEITKDTKLSDLSDILGERNVDIVLATNGLTRSPNIGKQLQDICDIKKNSGESSDIESFWRKKKSILNTMTQDSDIFEKAATMSDSDWNIMSSMMTFPSTIRIPDSIAIPDSANTIGNKVGVPKNIYQKAMQQLETYPHVIDPGIFNSFISIKKTKVTSKTSNLNQGSTQFHIPWGEVSFYSSISDSSVDIPVYPEEVEDFRKANYTTMPDILYQYEPWQIYDSSGPRSNTYSIEAHRDMWTGDHRDGKANEMIRFFQSNLYAKYSGSSLITPIVTLYVSGYALITGVLTDVSITWDGPIGLDGWYLHFKMNFTITEVSSTELNYETVKNIPLIG